MPKGGKRSKAPLKAPRRPPKEAAAADDSTDVWENEGVMQIISECSVATTVL